MSSFPVGQRPKGDFREASSCLLQELIRRSPQADAGAQEEGEGEGEAESEESSESEMPNLEVCAPRRPAAEPTDPSLSSGGVSP